MSADETSPPSLLVTASAMDFFHEQVVAARERCGIELTPDVEFYLVNLLCEFVSIEASAQDECLAMVFSKALESPYAERVHLFKRMGDTSLYFAGFFQEFFNRKSFDIGYYVAMGENAYSQLSDLMRGKGSNEKRMAKIYREMAAGFRSSADVLLDVSEHTGLTREPSRSTLSLYDAWLSTASEKLEEELLERGVLPIAVPRKAVQ